MSHHSEDHQRLLAREPSSTARWSSSAFWHELADWVAAALGVAVGDLALEPVKQRPWSTVWSARTADGLFYVKQNCPQQNFEARLVAALAEMVPRLVLRPVAVDAERGFLLTADRGPVLDDRAAADVDVWCDVVAGWAEVQRAVAAEPHRLDAVGLTALSPHGAAATFDSRIDLLASAGGPLRLPGREARRLREFAPSVRRCADEIAALGLPNTLNHNDLHDSNVFAPRGSEGLVFFDLADSLLTEPLGALLVPLRVVADVLGAGPEDPRLRRVAEAHLEGWSDVVPAAALRAALPAALRLACLARVESWLRCLASMTDAELADSGEAPQHNLLRVLEDPPVRF